MKLRKIVQLGSQTNEIVDSFMQIVSFAQLNERSLCSFAEKTFLKEQQRQNLHAPFHELRRKPRVKSISEKDKINSSFAHNVST